MILLVFFQGNLFCDRLPILWPYDVLQIWLQLARSHGRVLFRFRYGVRSHNAPRRHSASSEQGQTLLAERQNPPEKMTRLVELKRFSWDEFTLASMLTFASNFNILPTVMSTLMQRTGIEPIFCVCVLLPLLLLFSKTQTQTLTLSVNGPLKFRAWDWVRNHSWHANLLWSSPPKISMCKQKWSDHSR